MEYHDELALSFNRGGYVDMKTKEAKNSQSFTKAEDIYYKNKLLVRFSFNFAVVLICLSDNVR